MKKISVFILFMLPFFSFSQEETKKTTLKFYGFVRSDIFIDTYKGVNALEDLFYLYPNYIGQDATGNDINKQTTVNFLPIFTRLGVKIAGPEMLGAKTSAVVEADFAGKPTNFGLRLRHAYAKFDWESSSLLIGQTWHPFWAGHAYPRTGSLNTGAPFRAFNRSPQVRLDLKSGDFKISISGLYQQQFLSKGPIGNSSTYKRDAVIPETVVGVEYDNDGFTIGAALDYNAIKPRVSTEGTSGTFNTDEILSSLSFMGYAKYAKDKLMILGKGYYGQNLAHLLMLGGYGVSALDSITGREEYTNYNHASGLFNITYGKKWRPGLLLAYSKNLGTEDKLALNKEGKTMIYGLGTKIQDMYRISPSISYNIPKLSVILEYERTVANYGEGEINTDDGLYPDTHSTANNSVRLAMTYFF